MQEWPPRPQATEPPQSARPRRRNRLNPQELLGRSLPIPWLCNGCPWRAVVCGIRRSSSYRAVPACWTQFRPAQFFPGHVQPLETKTSIPEKPQGACTISYAHNPLYLSEDLVNFREQRTNDCHTVFPESSQEGKRGNGDARTAVWNPALKGHRFASAEEEAVAIRRRPPASARRAGRASSAPSSTVPQATARAGVQLLAGRLSSGFTRLSRQAHFLNIPFHQVRESNSVNSKGTKESKERNHAAQSIRGLARGVERWEGLDFYRYRRLEKDAILLQHTL